MDEEGRERMDWGEGRGVYVVCIRREGALKGLVGGWE